MVEKTLAYLEPGRVFFLREKNIGVELEDRLTSNSPFPQVCFRRVGLITIVSLD